MTDADITMMVVMFCLLWFLILIETERIIDKISNVIEILERRKK